jgi:transcriptional regulator with XRE-family HTH domain
MLNTAKLKKIRISKGLSLARLASKIGVNSSHVCNIENNKRGCSLEMLQAIVQALSISVEDIWEGTDTPALFPAQQDNGIVVEKIRFILPQTENTYKLISEQIVNANEADKDLQLLIALWKKCDNQEMKLKLLDILKENIDEQK